MSAMLRRSWPSWGSTRRAVARVRVMLMTVRSAVASIRLVFGAVFGQVQKGLFEVVLAGLLAQAVRACRRRSAALAHQQHPFAAGGLVHHMAGHQQGLARRRPGSSNSCQRSRRSTGSRPTVGSSSSSSSGSPTQRGSQRDPGALAAGQVRPVQRVLLSVQTDVGRGLLNADRRRAGQGGEVAQVLLHAEVGIHRAGLGHVGDPVAQAGRCRPAWPSTRTVPDRISWTPARQRISVVLPQPLGPIRPVTEPAGTAAVQLVDHHLARPDHGEVGDLDRRLGRR